LSILKSWASSSEVAMAAGWVRAHPLRPSTRAISEGDERQDHGLRSDHVKSLLCILSKYIRELTCEQASN
jgi:hypothetical protein